MYTCIHIRLHVNTMSYIINTLTWTVCVCLSITDVTSLLQRILWERCYKVYYNAFAGNEAPNCCSGRHAWSPLSRHSSYRRATKAGQTTLEQAKTVLSTSRILSQARLWHKRASWFSWNGKPYCNGRRGHLHRAIASVTGGLLWRNKRH